MELWLLKCLVNTLDLVSLTFWGIWVLLKQTLWLETVQYSTLCSGETMQSTFFLKMEIHLTDFSNLKGSFMNINQLFINIGIRGSKQKGAFKQKEVYVQTVGIQLLNLAWSQLYLCLIYVIKHNQ